MPAPLPLSALLLLLLFASVASSQSLAPPTYLKAGFPDSGDHFGLSVAVHGDTLVVGAEMEDAVGSDATDNSFPDRGAVYVFTRSGDSWAQQAYLKPGEPADWRFGRSVAIHGDTIAVGSADSLAPGGAVYVFQRAGTTWTQQVRLTPPVDGVCFGWDVALDGDQLAVSDPCGIFLPNTEGRVSVFERQGGQWVFRDTLFAPNGESTDQFGQTVDIEGELVLVGAPSEASAGDPANNGLNGAGAAYVFRRQGVVWPFDGYLKSAIPEQQAGFGRSVALAGETLLVGELNRVTAFEHGSGGWWISQVLERPPAASPSGSFGLTVAADQDRLLVSGGDGSVATGVNGNPLAPGPSGGAAWLFARPSAGDWALEAALKPLVADDDHSFGIVSGGQRSLGISGSLVLVGSHQDRSLSPGVGGDPTDDSGFHVGAATVFEFTQSPWSNLLGQTLGSEGWPTLRAEGDLLANSTTQFELTRAPPGAVLLAWLSFAPLPFEALGGTVHAYPFASQMFTVADGLGSFSASVHWPVGVPSGSEVTFQFLVEDVGIPGGITLSNGLRATSP